MTGFIKVYRDVLQCELLNNPIILKVWIFLCEQVRFRQTVQNGLEILPGQVLLSAGDIARGCNLPERKVRYILDCLSKQRLIRRENIRNRYSLITILDPTQQPTTKPAPVPTEKPAVQQQEQTAVPSPAVAAKTDTPVRSESEKGCYGLCCNVYLTAEEKRALQERCAFADVYIDNLSAYKRRTHKEYDDDFSVLCEWISKDDINEKRTAARQAATQLRREKEQSAKQDNAPPPCAEKQFLSSVTSYDLARAERKARESVPTLKKRRQVGT